MKPIAWHIVLRTRDGRALTTGPAERGRFVSVLGRYVDDYDIFGFDNPNDHGHVIAACPETGVGRLSRSLKNALYAALDLKSAFLPIEPRPIADRNHLLRTFHYVLGQGQRHGSVELDPLREASMLPDILGYRVVLRAAEVLHRVIGHAALKGVDLTRYLGGLEMKPGTDLRHLPDAAGSAVALPWSMSRNPLLVAARRAAVEVGLGLHATTAQLSSLLALSRARIRALRAAADADPRIVHAIRLQIGLREQAGVVPSR